MLDTIDAKVVDAIETLLHERMDPFGLARIDVHPGDDHAGDPVIFADAKYDLSARPIESKVVFDLETTLRNRVWELGERRFVHIRHRFDEAQKVAGYK